jgi:hypothetical protein
MFGTSGFVIFIVYAYIAQLIVAHCSNAIKLVILQVKIKPHQEVKNGFAVILVLGVYAKSNM